MATKVFCDVPGCGREVPEHYSHREIRVGKGAVRIVTVGDISPGDVCLYCLIDAFKALDDRTVVDPRYIPPQVRS